MKKIIKFLLDRKFSILLIALCLGLFSATIAYVYINPSFHRYEILYTTTEDIPANSKYKIEEVDGKYLIMGPKSTLEKKKIADEELKKELDKLYNNYEIVVDTKLNKINKVPVSLAFIGGSLVGLITGSVLVIIGKKKDHTLSDEEFYDNEKLFKYPFTPAYCKLCTTELKTTKRIALLGIFIALMFIAKALPIPSGFGNLGIGVTYLVLAIASMIYGPFVALLIGFISDHIGFFFFNNGAAYNFLYVINAMLTCFIYAVCFYRTKITFAKVLISRIFVNLFVNALLGSLWWGIYMKWDFEMTKVYMLFTSLPKNLAYLLPQTIMLFIVIKLVLPHLARQGLVDKKVAENVSMI